MESVATVTMETLSCRHGSVGQNGRGDKSLRLHHEDTVVRNQVQRHFYHFPIIFYKLSQTDPEN